jgi:hypothetical protein
MIVTRAEIKALLQITGTTQDTLIDALIPLVNNDIFEITNNRFLDTNIRYSSNTFTLSNTGKTIVDGNSRFLDYDFAGVQHINIMGSKYNDNNYKVTSITASTITLDSGSEIINESGNNIYITRVNYPASLKMIVAHMIKFKLNKNIGNGLKSENIDGYSYTLDDVSVGYPATINAMLTKYKKLGWS